MIDLRPDFLDTLKRLLAEIVPDCEVRIFGSRYQWTVTDASDLDLALVGPGKLHWKTLTRLKAALEESSLPYRVDVLDWRAISPEFQKVIKQGYEVIQKPGLGMSSNWNTMTLRDAGVYLIDCEHKTPDAKGNGYPYIAIPQIKNGRIDLANVRLISREDLMTWTRKAKPQVHDVVLSRRCNPGETAFVPPNLECAIGQNLVLLRADGEKFYPPFLRWLVSGPEWWNQIQKYLNAGAIFNSLKCADIPNFELKIPPLSTQRRIADILSALDEKIELNRQTNATLEAIAQTIFKEWFVDFNFPGTTGEMVESELGMIPKGWTVGKIKDFSKRIQYGLTQSASTMEIGPHFLRITDIQNGQINWADVPYCVVDEKYTEKYKIDNYDIFIARTGASTGENVLAINPPDAVFASYLIRVQFTKPQLAVYVGKLLRSRQYFEFIDSIKSGSAQPNANAQQLTDFDIVLPMLDILGNYFRIVADIENMKAEYQAQSATLATIRDALLPKLMSGEIEV